MLKGIIYKTTNIINGMWYIGKDEKNDPSYLGSGIYLSRAIAKYGKENFIKEIIDYAETSEKLALLEIHYIEKYNATKDDMSYNIASGGFGGDTISGMSEIDKLKFSTKMCEVWDNLTIEVKQNKISKMNNSVRGKSKTQSHKNKISKSKTGVKQSAETIEKKKLISKKLYDEGKICPPKNNWTGKTHKQETKNLISKKKTGIKNYKTRLFTPDQQKEIYLLYKGGMSTKDLAQLFKTTGPTILRYIKEISN